MLVPVPAQQPPLTNIPPEVLGLYSDTLEHLGDADAGHLLGHPLKKKLATAPGSLKGFRAANPQQGDLILVEVVDGTIVGIGHHFRHRRRYRDTVHLSPKGRDNPPAGHPGHADRLRAILCPTPLETLVQETGPYCGAPKQLTAARCLFGFVGPEKPTYDPDRPNEALTFGIGRDDFRQLAGRIAFNCAVEQEDPGRSGRFLNETADCLVPLRPLGEPKPSAVETYLTQDRLGDREDLGTLCTYGDTLDDPAAGDLGGESSIPISRRRRPTRAGTRSPDRPTRTGRSARRITLY